MKNLVMVASIVLAAGPAMAQFLSAGTLSHVSDSSDYFSGGKESRGHIYIIPNEINPESARPIIQKAPEGVYISVGAERGILGALQSESITHLVQVDLVPEVVRYNQINVILLKVSKSLSDFIQLRTADNSTAWIERAGSAALNPQEREILKNHLNHDFYVKVEGAARERLISPDFFVGSSYLKDESLFNKARNMALSGHIQVLQGNLMDQNLLKGLAAELAQKGLSISVVDLSNAWEPKYVGPQGVDTIVSALEPALRPDSIVMGTSVAHCFESHLCRWDFRGFTFRMLKSAKLIYGKYAPMSDLFLKKDAIKPNSVLSRWEFIKLAVSARPDRPIVACEKVFLK
ncbi:hypothetical protein ACLVWU_07625 [Bdellovibrio sp. HCB290]|uniref:LIC_10091 family protein n=1 Tax=Bdellovibrio sp. HCB290 TaxID=3394356 RepID=UPI0039B3F300